jgi:XTP/dITP diphosphohydrolase
MNCFADDTGLEIEVLNNEPGVFSARYAGENCTYEDNVDKVLLKLKGTDNRQAKFRTVIALALNGRKYLFEGEIKGIITLEKNGTNGFGYDPVFIPHGFEKTFAEMSPEEKNQISHRTLALNKLVEFFRENGY